MNGGIKVNEAVKFIAVGIGGVVADYLVYGGLMWLGVNMLAAKGLSYLAVASITFVLNTRWTFRRARFVKLELFRYAAVYDFSAGVNTAINKAVVILCGVKLLAFLVATGASSVVNFLGLKFFVFTKK